MDLSHRKVAKTLKIVDSSGNPASNKQIKVTLKNHEFLFGCGAFDSIPYVMGVNDPSLPPAEDTMNKWLDLFNYGTLPFYWGMYEKEEGKDDRDTLRPAAEFLTGRGTTVKGHPLCWHTVCADWLMNYDNKTILKKQLERIDREVTLYKGLIDMWDVINEVIIMPIFDKYDNAITRICKENGRVGLIKKVFEEAHACNPDATLLLNDFNTSISYEILIDGCLEAGVPISAIGIQSHQHQGYWGKEKLEEVLDRFSHFGLPIHFTENTIVSGSLIPEYIEDLNDWQVDEWPTTPEGEERQAKQIEEIYRILFAHPQVEAITTWDFKDGAWLGAPSGLLRKDNSIKPSYEMLKKLIHEEWNTDETLVTDENGYIKVEGFKGEYEISSSEGKTTVKLSDDKEMIVVL
ncbi:MAG: endo-1,4-beta-xylanase [Lachnospiraceae bacterium]|nr:endo-1,4-beta-xylanase [Lachnospiraceae bacterium]